LKEEKFVRREFLKVVKKMAKKDAEKYNNPKVKFEKVADGYSPSVFSSGKFRTIDPYLD
jgi:hypothetical protein